MLVHPLVIGFLASGHLKPCMSKPIPECRIAPVATSEDRSYHELANHARMLDRHLQGDRAATAESKNIGLIYMEILEQRSRIICGLFEAERPVCYVRGVAVSLLMERRCIATDIATPARIRPLSFREHNMR